MDGSTPSRGASRLSVRRKRITSAPLAQHSGDQLFITHLLRVELDAHRLGVACEDEAPPSVRRRGRAGAREGREGEGTVSAAHAVVRWIVALASRVPVHGGRVTSRSAKHGDGEVGAAYPTEEETTPGSRSNSACGPQNHPNAKTATSVRRWSLPLGHAICARA